MHSFYILRIIKYFFHEKFVNKHFFTGGLVNKDTNVKVSKLFGNILITFSFLFCQN